MQRIVVWGMKCVSYDYEFENDLATKWRALDRATPLESEGTKRSSATRRPRRKKWTVTDSEDEDDVPAAARLRGYLSRIRRGKLAALREDSASVAASGEGGSSDEDDDDLYHDADVGDLSA